MWKQSCAILTLASLLATHQATAADLQGIWAMVPLKSGIANVIEFGVDQATVHAFECYGKGEADQSADPETSTYTRQDQIISLSSDGQAAGSLEIKALSANELTLFQAIDGMPNGGTSFVYRKASSVKPLCELYQEPS
ncbi:MAG: lipocalin family protein [Moraxellaceae bacterium]